MLDCGFSLLLVDWLAGDSERWHSIVLPIEHDGRCCLIYLGAGMWRLRMV